MGRNLSKKSKYYLPKPVREAMIKYAKLYPGWRARYNAIGGTKAMTISDMPRSGNLIDTTQRDGIRRAELDEKMNQIEDAAIKTDSSLFRYILIGVTEDLSYEIMRARHRIPCGKNEYYAKKRRFYYILAQERGEI